MIRTLGHLALWPTLYTIGVLLLLGMLTSGEVPDWAAFCFVGFCAQGCYLLDRVKAADSRLDPADLIAQPQRYTFLHKHTVPVRVLVVVDLVLAIVAGMILNPLLVWIPPAALVGVHLYAGRSAGSSRPRPKDLPGLKAVFIAGAHLSLGIAALIGERGIAIVEPSETSLIVAMAVGVIIFGDALLCDLDDQESDKLFRTQSIPVLIGRNGSWALAVGAHAAGLCMLMLGVGWTPAIGIFAGGLLLSDALFTMLSKQRDAVDARLLVLVLLLVLASG